jgi:hypothetical protein
MHIRFRAILICALVALPLAAQAQTFPGADWQRKTPAEAGINPQLIALPDLLPGPEARQRWIAFIGGVRYRCTKHRQRSDTG